MSDRPPLHPTVWEQIERLAKRVDADCWQQLKGFQVHYEGPSTLSPPRTPQLLQNRLEMYAGALFRNEFDQYLKGDERYGDWLASLSERVVERVLHAVDELEEIEGPAKLSYHGLSPDEMRERLERFFAVILSRYTGRPIAAKPKREDTTPPALDDADTNPEIARREALLAAYKTQFPEAKFLDICWAARQDYREFKRWRKNDPKLKDGLTADSAFRRVLTSGKKPQELRREPRPKNRR